MVEGENVTESLWRSGIKPPICRWTAVLPPEPQPLNVLKGFEASFLFPQLVHITLLLILMYTCRTVDIAMSWKLLAGSRQAVVSYLNMLKFVFLSTTFHRPESYDFWEIHSHESLLFHCQPTTEHIIRMITQMYVLRHADVFLNTFKKSCPLGYKWQMLACLHAKLMNMVNIILTKHWHEH